MAKELCFLLLSLHYLVPVLTGVVNLFDRAWLKNINKSVKKDKIIKCIFM